MLVRIICANIHKRSNVFEGNYGRYVKLLIYCTLYEKSFLLFSLIHVSKESGSEKKKLKLICPSSPGKGKPSSPLCLR